MISNITFGGSPKIDTFKQVTFTVNDETQINALLGYDKNKWVLILGAKETITLINDQGFKTEDFSAAEAAVVTTWNSLEL